MALFDFLKGKNKEVLEEKFIVKSGGQEDRFLALLEEEF